MKQTFALFPVLALLASSALAADEPGFVPLFDGKDTSGWHLRRKDGHNSWKVEDGILKNIVNPGEHGTDLVTDKKFWNFTVKYDFMVPDNSNSGFYLRGRHEIQILGDYKSGKTSKGSNGAIYNHTAPSVFASKPGGEWQTVEATIIDNKIDQPGPIFLKGDHGTVWFRNIRIKELPKT